MQMQIVHHTGIVTVDCVGESSEHAHALKNSDCYEQPSVFSFLAIREVGDDYSVAEIAQNLCEVNCPAD